MRVIVYGSLKRSQGNSHWMTNGQLIGVCQLAGYEIYDLGYYPAVIAGDGEISCEVYRINAEILAELDHLKNYGRDYRRELIDTPHGYAWIYLYLHSVAELPRIESGDWNKRNIKVK